LKRDENGESVGGATVVLFSSDPARQESRWPWVRTTPADQNGSFRFAGLAPGEYLICALLDHEGGAEGFKEYIQELAKSAKKISLQPRGKLFQSLPVQAAPAVQ